MQLCVFVWLTVEAAGLEVIGAFETAEPEEAAALKGVLETGAKESDSAALLAGTEEAGAEELIVWEGTGSGLSAD